MSIRPEEFVISQNDEGIEAVVDDSVFLGLNTHYFVHLTTGEKVEIIQESMIDSVISKNAKVYLKVKSEKINVFDFKGERNLLEGVKNDADTVFNDVQYLDDDKSK